MKTILFIVSFVFLIASFSKAAPPPTFDPQRDNQEIIRGSCYVVQTPFLTGMKQYIILTYSHKDEAIKNYRALADRFVINPLLGKYVSITAMRIKATDKKQPQFRILSAKEIIDF